MNDTKPILAVGSIALDSLETHDGSRREILGGSATYFSISASLFAPVRLVGVVGDDFPESGWKLLKSRGIDLTNVQIIPGKTFRWGAKYSDDFSTRDTLFTELGVFESFQPDIVDGYRDTPFLFLGNIQPELQMSVSGMVPGAELVICDTMNLWIDCNVEKLKSVLKKVNIFLLNDEEAFQLSGEENIYSAADCLLDMGPRAVVIKQGAKGALLAGSFGKIHVPVYPYVNVVDPTGAGDTFAGGLIGHISRHGTDDLTEAVITGAAVASYTVSGFGLEGILQATNDSIEERRNIIKKLMRAKASA